MCLGVVYAKHILGLYSMDEGYTPSSYPLLLLRLGIYFTFFLRDLACHLTYLGDFDPPPLVSGSLQVPLYVIFYRFFGRALVHHIGKLPQISLRSYHLALCKSPRL